MHRIPRFFSREKEKSMDSKMKLRRPKLDRRYALKNVDYDATTSSSEESCALRTRSLDLSPIGDRTSFRIEGTEGEIDKIYQTLGLSEPEDFGIPLAAWEARKMRSSSDLLPRSRLNKGLDFTKFEARDGLDKEMAVLFDSNVRVGDVADERIETAQLITSCTGGDGGNVEICNSCTTGSDGGNVEICKLSDKLEESGLVVNWNRGDKSVECAVPIELSGGGGRGGGSGGIKGVRPPFLAPPPSISLPVIDNYGSTWDIMRSFAPDDGRSSSIVNLGGFSYADEEEDDGEVVREQIWVGETAVLSGSCSFTTTSNDDDSSSTTTATENISPNGRFIRCITNWQKGELLGRGSFGSVYEGIADGGFFFAVKEVSLLDQGDQGKQSIVQLEQEIALLSQFEHENILQYYGTDKDASKLYIFLELVTKGSLLRLYQKYHLQDSQVSAYTRQILHGLKYLHDKNVVHRDIKCANILVDASGSVKLADFGLAKATKLNDVKSCKGTVFWMAPEVVNGQNKGYGLAADIWSLGCTVLEMLTRQLPYYPLECMQAMFRIGRAIPPPVPESLSTDARSFILQCLQVNPDFRPTAAQLLDHPFVKRALLSTSGSASPYNLGRRV
ncbi:hypothetical protein LguiA_004554 [Lonicera macranthoides]